jgi:hypothetical protein
VTDAAIWALLTIMAIFVGTYAYDVIKSHRDSGRSHGRQGTGG